MTQRVDPVEATMADLEARIEAAKSRDDGLDRDAIELILLEAGRLVTKLNVSCNILLNRPGGIPAPAIDILHDLKLDLCRLRYWLDHPIT